MAGNQWRRLAAVVGATALLLMIVPLSGEAATPGSGTMTPPTDNALGVKSTLTYEGAAVSGALLLQQTAAEPACATTPTPPPVQCDQFDLKLNLPAGYWDAKAGKASGYLEASIEWDDSSGGQATPDIDLLVNDSTGKQVGSGETDNLASGVPKETARVLMPGPGTYHLIAVGIVGSVPSYHGTVKFVLGAPEAIATLPATNVQFGPTTVVDPSVFGGEPGLNADPSGGSRWWIDWPIGTRAQIGSLHRSTDGGDTFRMMTNPNCPARRGPGCLKGGGGDTETAISKNGVVYWSDQEALGNESANVSTDHGMTWPSDREHAITQLTGNTDRQWLAARDDNTAYLANSVTSGVHISKTTDGGKNWTDATDPVGGLPGSSAPLVMDNTGGPQDGTLYLLTRGTALTISVSRDGAKTWKSYPDADPPTNGPGAGFKPDPLLIPWMTIDRAGNLYVVWSDSTDHAVHLTTMSVNDPRNAGAKAGSTWSTPVKVSIPPARSTVFTQVIAGDPGRVAIVYQGADTPETSSSAPTGTPWNIYAAVGTDALCQWSGSCTVGGLPTFQQTAVNEHVNHYDDICVSGIGCTANPDANRNLADFFDVGYDADGRIGVTWSDDNNDLHGVYQAFAKLQSGPSLLAGRPAFRAGIASTGIKAPAGNAIWPINAPGGKNYDTLDLTGTSVSRTGDTYTINVDLASLSNRAAGLAAGYNGQHIKYLTRWWWGPQSWFVVMDQGGGQTAPTFYGGKVDANDPLLKQGVTSVYGTRYVKDFDVQGAVNGNTITFTVPAKVIGNPSATDRLLSVQSFTMTALQDELQSLETAPDTIDATPPFDYTPGAPATPAGAVTHPNTARVGAAGARTAATGRDSRWALVALALLVMALLGRRLRRAARH